MAKSLCKLTIVCPRSIRRHVRDILLEGPAGGSGFSEISILGHGQPSALTSASEKVSGMAENSMFQLVLNEGNVAQILDEVQAKLNRPGLSYWTEPVLEFGILS
ncbi:DUF3240 family protein [Parvularcula lutaonensis]|uniref:DUF3240 family protein n=1 Tax=Parvularcula lutaonensis TaxID=491923 RepID=A0ABV7MCD4_9PROT|nr:DUF3240 family protein [Parvularcula lutaonensis]GGY37734.1 hypothetical protein GCM10007148_02510 [Parvularcula lutaonensis]